MIADPLRDNALLAVELGAFSDTLDDHIHLAVGLAAAVREHKLVGCRAARFFPFFEPLNQACRQRNNALLPVLRREAPVGLRLYPYIVVAEVDVLPLDATDLLVAEAGAEHELEQRRFVADRRPEHRLQLFRLSIRLR